MKTQRSTTNQIMSGLWLALFALMLALSAARAQTTNYFYESFETAQALDDWSVEGGTWEIGVPTSGPPTNSLGRRAFAGTNCAATVLSGNYGTAADTRLMSPSFMVPPAAANPRLRFWHWFDVGRFDGGFVEIRIGTNTWQTISPTYTGTSSGAWTRPSLDLSAFAGQTVQIAFRFQAGYGNYSDDISTGW
ncbi:MAG: choice-of-anchor J domain-containing protein [Chloroflexi bacterium]|nr:choice-of-anchor J domain-containing protein [Chloroflexota bacterium]